MTAQINESDRGRERGRERGRGRESSNVIKNVGDCDFG
jgi:hypothetical protein